MALRSVAVKSRGVVTAPLILKSEGPVEGLGAAACCAQTEIASSSRIEAAEKMRRIGNSFLKRIEEGSNVASEPARKFDPGICSARLQAGTLEPTRMPA